MPLRNTDRDYGRGDGRPDLRGGTDRDGYGDPRGGERGRDDGWSRSRHGSPPRRDAQELVGDHGYEADREGSYRYDPRHAAAEAHPIGRTTTYGGSDDRGVGERYVDRGERSYAEHVYGSPPAMGPSAHDAWKSSGAEGKPPKGYTRSDERIREDVCDRLVETGHDWSELEVVVQGGEVTLAGTVSDRARKHQAEHIAETVRGVTDVANRIKVRAH